MNYLEEAKIHAAINAKRPGFAETPLVKIAVLADTCCLLLTPRPLDDWCEEEGPALWWAFPINEPPYVGSPLDSDWPDYHTHWTPIVCPQEPPANGK